MKKKGKIKGQNRKNRSKLVKKTSYEISPVTYILLWGREFSKKNLGEGKRNQILVRIYSSVHLVFGGAL